MTDPDRKRRSAGETDRAILEVVEGARRPLSGHDIAWELASVGVRMLPSQVFRSLNKLRDRRLVHRVEVLNSYVAGPSGSTMTFVCTECRQVSQVPASELFERLGWLAAQRGFRSYEPVLELTGRCHACVDSISS